MTISVFLADDDAGFRGAYKKLFDRTEGFRVAGEAADGVEAVRLITALKPAVALLDVQMPGLTGLAAAARIVATGRTRVIMLTTFDLDDYVREALTAGVAGFLLKNASPAEVLHAVRVVDAGNAMLAPEVTARMLERLTPRAPQRPHAFADHVLSDRELQVVRLVARGHSNQRIADELVLSLAAGGSLLIAMCWLTVAIINHEDPVRRSISVVLAGGSSRVLAAEVLLALLAGSALALVGLIFSGRHSWTGTDLEAGLLALLTTVFAGVAVGVLCSRLVVPRPGYSLLLALVVVIALPLLPGLPPINPMLKTLASSRPPADQLAPLAGDLLISVALLAICVAGARFVAVP